MRTSPLAALLLATCVPPEPPAWLIDEPTFLGIQTAVVDEGPLTKLIASYPGHERAWPLPFDTVEWRWFGAAPPDVEVHPPIWIQCARNDCALYGYELLGIVGDLPPCPDPLSFEPPVSCRMGVGHRLRTRLTGVEPDSDSARVLVVTSAEEDPETCLDRVLRNTGASLGPCLVAAHGIPNLSKWLLKPPPQDIPEALPPGFLGPMNTNPTLSFAIHRSDGDIVPAVDGDTITVTAGEPIEVDIRPGPDAAQVYYVLYQDNGLSLRVEALTVDAYLDRDDVDYTKIDAGKLQLTAPDDATPINLYVRMLDDRGGSGFAALRFLAIRGPS